MDASPLRVRTAHRMTADFCVVAGQRNVEFKRGPLTPHQRFWTAGMAVAAVEPLGYDLLHSFNAIPLMSVKPWIVTFEDYLPRVPEDRPHPAMERLLTRRLHDPRCRRILALSEYARRQFRKQHEAEPDASTLVDKMDVVHPGVRVRVQRPHPRRSLGDPIRLISVGSDWLRKGFPATLLAHKELRARGVPVHTTLVSQLALPAGDYVGPAAPELERGYRQLIDQPGVVHVPGASNGEVLRLMEDADYLVFPTFHDTFGYVMIEAMGGGTPVIASDTCAVPEVLGPEMVDLLIPFPNESQVGKWERLYSVQDASYAEAYDDQIGRSAAVIADTVTALASDRDRVQYQSELALERCRTEFSLGVLRRRLEPIYAAAVA